MIKLSDMQGANHRFGFADLQGHKINIINANALRLLYHISEILSIISADFSAC